MISESTYKAASMVAERMEAHFRDQIQAAEESGEEGLAPSPKAWVIEAMTDAAFWASLRREEGHSPKISLAYLPPEKAGYPMLFEHQIRLTSDILTKLSPGVERPGVHLGVWHEKNDLYIWGTTLRIPNLCFVLDVSEPGLLVIKHRRFSGLGKFANVAVLSGDQIKILDENSPNHAEYPDLLKSLLGFTSLDSWNDSVNTLILMAVSMRNHKHGGTLLVVPSHSENWRKSIIHPLKYAIHPPYSGLVNLLQEDPENREAIWQAKIRSEIDSMAGLTAVDGATIINRNFELLAFGTKITRVDGNGQVDQMTLIEPVIGGEPVIVNPSLTGGSRHLSAAQFVNDQKESLALVASQDGHFTIFSWSDKINMVMAHRIDTLLL